MDRTIAIAAITVLILLVWVAIKRTVCGESLTIITGIVNHKDYRRRLIDDWNCWWELTDGGQVPLRGE